MSTSVTVIVAGYAVVLLVCLAVELAAVLRVRRSGGEKKELFVSSWILMAGPLMAGALLRGLFHSDTSVPPFLFSLLVVAAAGAALTRAVNWHSSKIATAPVAGLAAALAGSVALGLVP